MDRPTVDRIGAHNLMTRGRGVSAAGPGDTHLTGVEMAALRARNQIAAAGLIALHGGDEAAADTARRLIKNSF